jgi:hypothetical protein
MIPMSPFDDAGWSAQPAALPMAGDRPQSALARVGRARGPRTVDVMVSRLRRSLQACDRGEGLIQTVRSGGYRLDATVETTAAGVIIHG